MSESRRQATDTAYQDGFVAGSRAAYTACIRAVASVAGNYHADNSAQKALHEATAAIYAAFEAAFASTPRREDQP